MYQGFLMMCSKIEKHFSWQPVLADWNVRLILVTSFSYSEAAWKYILFLFTVKNFQSCDWDGQNNSGFSASGDTTTSRIPYCCTINLNDTYPVAWFGKMSKIFWDISHSGPLKVNRHLGETYSFHLQGWIINQSGNQPEACSKQSLKIEVTHSFETLIDFQLIIRSCNPEGRIAVRI
jgi:hypothetical protein